MFWRAVCTEVATSVAQQVSVNPLMCLLGKIPVSLKKKSGSGPVPFDDSKEGNNGEVDHG